MVHECKLHGEVHGESMHVVEGLTKKQVQMKKDYYEPYRTVIKDMYAKPMEYQIMERMPGNQWVSIKSEMTK